MHLFQCINKIQRICIHFITLHVLNKYGWIEKDMENVGIKKTFQLPA